MKLKLIIALLLALLMVLTMVACNKNDTPGNDGSDTTPADGIVDGDNTTPDGSADPDGCITPDDNTTLSIVQNGITEYRVIRPDTCSNEVTNAASDLRKAIMDKYAIEKMTISTDFEMKGTDPATRYPYEILVGVTNRSETTNALKTIKYNDFIITASGTRAVITGGNDAKTVEAVQYFVDNFLTDGALTLDSQSTYHHKGTYEFENATLMGVKLSEYTIVCGNSYKSIAKIVADELGERCGAIINVVNDGADPVQHEIVIGSAKRGNTKTYSTDYDYSITVADGKVYVGGRNTTSVGCGCRELLTLIKKAEGKDVAASALNVNYTLPDRQAYIDDISLLAMPWAIYMDTPEWMLDFEEKTAAMRDVDGRLMSCLHRGDMVYYPENSIEGFISSIRLGGDMIEIDPRLTKDGVFVLIHDETLNRTTNYEELAGKNGLPTSNKVEDWTYAQLQQLNLKERTGGDGAKLTPYKIPTMDEVFKVAANRIFIRLDVKGDSTHDICWNYEKDIWPLMQKYKSYTNVIYTWHYAFYNNAYRLVKTYKSLQKTACGDSAFCFVGLNTKNNPSSALTTIKSNNLDYCVRLTNCDFSDISAEDFVTTNKAKLAVLKGKARVYIDAHGGGSKYETEKDWEMLNEAGINLLLVNKGFKLCQYICENFEPTQK